MTFIDSHCHLPNLRHKDELEKILSDAKEWGVDNFINIGTSIKENIEAVEVAEAYPDIYATVAIYPHKHRSENIDTLIDQLKEQARSSKKIVAIGECGVDITEWEHQRPVEEQMVLFEKQVELSIELDLPLIIHNRNGSEQILNILARSKGVRGVVHCFDSTWEMAQKFLNLGFYLSFSGLITYESRQARLEVVKQVPAKSFLLETDAPYLLPEPARSQASVSGGSRKNAPKYVRMVGQKVAEVREAELEEIALQAGVNTRLLFGLES